VRRIRRPTEESDLMTDRMDFDYDRPQELGLTAGKRVETGDDGVKGNKEVGEMREMSEERCSKSHRLAIWMRTKERRMH
jgi:hypothetical protein